MQMKFPITVIYLDKKDKLKILYDTLVTFRHLDSQQISEN
jgi:hypothetical protein